MKIPPKVDDSLVSLSKREQEVLALIVEGSSFVRIATRLHISEKTVSTHKRKIMDKLNIHTIGELTQFAIWKGITTPDA
ncbi:MAG: helix-turn-helix transcriptional regulator [Desulfobacula sp.]|nr:helix-turn-helix transcriptional regulator [Desulfobacula sp.]